MHISSVVSPAQECSRWLKATLVCSAVTCTYDFYPRWSTLAKYIPKKDTEVSKGNEISGVQDFMRA